MQAAAKPPSHVLRLDTPLRPFFGPRNVAVIGATDKAGSVGLSVMTNLTKTSFGGSVFPVNPHRTHVLGLPVYAAIADVPRSVDLAVIVTPAATVPAVVRECVQRGVPAAIVISAGFKEQGTAGATLEQQVLEEARRGPMRIIGPNCLGVMCPTTGLNATFAAQTAKRGHVGFISQSGALCTAVLDWSLQANVGFSAFVSIGSMLDVSWGDLIDYLGDDPHTTSIVLYMESIGDARAFLSAAREVALTKPIIVIKGGRTQAAAKAAASHTGSLAGSDLVLDTAFRRSGVLRVDTIAELFYMADVLGKQPRPVGPRLTILTNAGGPGVLATDALIANGGVLASPSAATLNALNGVLPSAWSHGNPIDILGDATPERLGAALAVAMADEQSDGLLVIYTPQGVMDPISAAEVVRDRAPRITKPIVASWMGGASVDAGQTVLEAANIPTFPFPDTAARIFTHMWRYTYNLRGLYETPAIATDQSRDASTRALAVITTAHLAGRTLLTELESKQLLSACGIPVVEARYAASEEEAVVHAEAIGYPVVLKLHSYTLTHKSDVGGVALNVTQARAVREAFRRIQTSVTTKAGPQHFDGVTVQPMIAVDGYELIVGSSLDPQFGPVLLFGSGGRLVEVYRDRALALPPLNTTLARRLMEQAKVFAALEGIRGVAPVDLDALERLLVRFSELVVQQPRIKEIDINPLLASSDRIVALDGRVVLHPPEFGDADLPRSAIRPYPLQYERPWTLRDGTAVTIRPIRPEDEPLMREFHRNISEQSVYFRYLHLMALSARVAHERLTRVCFIDYAREMALVAEHRNQQGQPSILGVGRLIKLHGTKDAEFALVVVDARQGQGLGTELLGRLVQIGRDEKLSRIVATIAVENRDMQAVARKLGFSVRYDPTDQLMRAVLVL
jgi:acetyltransferase